MLSFSVIGNSYAGANLHLQILNITGIYKEHKETSAMLGKAPTVLHLIVMSVFISLFLGILYYKVK